MNLLELFLAGAERGGNKPAIIDDDQVITFRTLVRASKGLAALLSSRTDKDVIGIFLPTCKEFVITYLACLMTGKTTLPFNILLSPEDLSFVAHDAEVDTVVTSRRFLKIIDREKAIHEAVPNVLCLEDLAGGRLKKLLLLARGVFFRIRYAPEDSPATLLYTSGTTGRPKGVRLSHNNLVWNIKTSIGVSGYAAEDVAVQVLPLFHTFALTVTMGAPLARGGTSVAMKRFVPDQVLEAIERHKVTFLVAIPSMFRVLNRAQQQKPRDVSSLTCVISGGEPLPGEVRERFEKLFGIEILEGYGLTECSPVVSLNPPGANRPGSVGKPLPGLEVRAFAGNGSPAPPGADGELAVKGPGVMLGYHRKPEATAAVLKDGWFRTGDIGHLDADGYVWITGREKEMMIVGGENVFPAEIEDVISRHPAVMEAGVIGVPDERRGEAPKAFVVLEPGHNADASELVSFCREKLPPYKVPKEVAFKESLPKSPTGKVLRKALREL